ncbi:MAG: hypothetical protein U9R73_00810 [Pseudomonadota bacterium]|nr:hypothetical protein [Pseudomonadota bacterium]
MRKVFKYRLNGSGAITEVDAASLSDPVLVAEQRGEPHIWLEAFSTVTFKRRFLVVGTGWDIPEQAKHVGSYQSAGGVFIWHVYELFGSAA